MNSSISLTTGGKIALAVVFLALLIGMGTRIYRRLYPPVVFIPNDIQVTIPEGMNIADTDKIISDAGVAPAGFLLASASSNLEGYLFPDTYRFEKYSSVEDVVARLRENFDNKTSGVGINERTLIIASMLEKEVQTENDMRLVAGIIEKRLSVGMPLQLDATVAYGACHTQFLLGQYCDVSKISIVDNLQRDSAYNTYTRVSLPVGPISNPGLRAISAAMRPVSSDYWYYLSAKDGTTIFSRTLEEHNRARAKYLR